VVYNYSMETWVTFKFVGLIGLQLLYVVIMMVYLVRIGAIKDDDAAASAQSDNKNSTEA